MIDIIKNPDASFNSIQAATNELLKMARLADKYIEISLYKDGECVEQYVDLKDWSILWIPKPTKTLLNDASRKRL